MKWQTAFVNIWLLVTCYINVIMTNALWFINHFDLNRLKPEVNRIRFDFKKGERQQIKHMATLFLVEPLRNFMHYSKKKILKFS